MECFVSKRESREGPSEQNTSFYLACLAINYAGLFALAIKTRAHVDECQGRCTRWDIDRGEKEKKLRGFYPSLQSDA